MSRKQKPLRVFREEHRPEGEPTKTQWQALVWLNRRNGTGVFGVSKKGVDSSTNVLLAAGDRGPFMKTIWNELVEGGFATQEGKRLTVTEKGSKYTHLPPPYKRNPNKGKSYGLPSADALDGADSIESFDDDLDEGFGDEMED